MCGITGYIGQNVERNLIDGLKLLEYRGYDSAGIAVLNSEIKITKGSGKINDLENNVSYSTNFSCGIAHTRWATHGAPTTINAHPHISNNNAWAVVHNGIIENFTELKNELKNKGYKFKSETDTEVICNLLQDDTSYTAIQKLINISKKLTGAYALACLNRDYKNTLFLAKNKSPLFIASSGSNIYVASDIICFKGKANKYYEMNDLEFCIANTKNIDFFDKNGKKIKKNAKLMQNFDISVTKNNYPHYMLKEIYETQNVLKNLVETYKEKNLFGFLTCSFISKFSNIVLVGCGTAHHASQMGAKFLQEYARVNANAQIASEYRYSKPIIDNNTLCILVSQSGETADTLAVCEMAKQNNATTIALTNVLYSSLARICDYVLPVCANTEIAVASTKAYTAQISALYMLAKHLENEKFNKNYDYFEDISQIYNNYSFNYEQIKDISQILTKAKNVFFIGRNYDYITAQESSLKLKEITYIFSSEHPAGELKHGFLALIDKKSYLFAIATNKRLLDKTLNATFEAEARGAKIILATQLDLSKEVLKKFYKVIHLPKLNENIMPIASIIPFQLLAYYTSINKGINPDQPRNLAKSVTVE